jgi:hypothetical protein
MANQGTPKPVASDRARLRGKRTAPQQAPQGVKLLVTIVSRSKAEFYMDLLQSLEVNVQLALLGYGTASTDMLQLLGLGNSEKSVIFSMVREDRAREALSLLDEKFKTVRGGKGIAYTIPLKSVVGVAIYRFMTNNRMPTNGKGE